VAVKIRLRRMGRKKKPIWAVVAADSRAPRDGKFIEDLGRYFPLEEPARIELKSDRIKYWLKEGAQPTDTVRSLLSRDGILLGLHLERKGLESEAIEEAVSAHQKYRIEKLTSQSKLTVSDRRNSAMEVEVKEAEKREAELIEKRKKAVAKAAEEKARKEAKAGADQLNQTAEQNPTDEGTEEQPTEASNEEVMDDSAEVVSAESNEESVDDTAGVQTEDSAEEEVQNSDKS